MPLAAAAELTYIELAEAARLPVHPRSLEAAADALSVFVPFHASAEGPLVARRDLEHGLAQLRRAGVRFSEVWP